MTTEERLAKVERELAATRKKLADLRAGTHGGGAMFSLAKACSQPPREH